MVCPYFVCFRIIAYSEFLCINWRFVRMWRKFAWQHHFSKREVLVHEPNLTLLLFIEVSFPIHESFQSCICVKSINCTCFFGFSIEYWKCVSLYLSWCRSWCSKLKWISIQLYMSVVFPSFRIIAYSLISWIRLCINWLG